MKAVFKTKWAAYSAALLFWLGFWHICAVKAELSFMLPKPLEVFKRFFELLGHFAFYQTLLISLLRVTVGFLGGLFLGVLSGFLSHRFFWARSLISPMMSVIKATPVASFILVVILWIERGGVPSFISLLMVLPIVWQNTVLGLEKRDPALGEMAQVFRLGKWRTLLRVDLPQVIPFILSASKTGMGLSWKAGIAAEVLALPAESVGEMIHNAKLYLETVDLYAWTLAIILTSVLLEKLFSALFSPKKGGRYADPQKAVQGL